MESFHRVWTPAIGWLSSALLLLTIGKQVHTQWKSRSTEGVSRYLFWGQMAASLGFTVYSWLQHDWVFVVTNFLMAVSATVGLVLRAHARQPSTLAPRERVL